MIEYTEKCNYNRAFFISEEKESYTMDSKNKIIGFRLDKEVLEMYRELTVENKKKLVDYLQYLQWMEIEKAHLRIEEIMEYEMKEIEED